MILNSVTNVCNYPVKNLPKKKIRANSGLTSVDTVSFSGSKKSVNQSFKYADSWYLKDEEIVNQDDFTTTIIDKTHKRSLMDRIRNKKYTRKIYDLPLRLREDLKRNNTDTIIQNVPADLLKETGLTNRELIKEIDKINSLIMLVAPRYDTFEEKTKQEFNIKLGSKIANVKRLSQGLSGSLYEIKVPDCKPLALKHYLNPMNINSQEGAFPEIALAKKMNEDKVCNIPLLYYANPYNGWMLSDFVDKNYEKRQNGISFIDYLEKNKLIPKDINSGILVKGKDNTPIFVDYGYIMPFGASANDYQNVIYSDNTEKVNNNKYLDNDDVSDLTKFATISMYGDENTIKRTITKAKTTPELQFFIDASTAVRMTLKEKEIPEDIACRLKENYEKSGFIGDVIELIKSCDQ